MYDERGAWKMVTVAYDVILEFSCVALRLFGYERCSKASNDLFDCKAAH